MKITALRTFLLAKKGSGGGNYGLFFQVFGEQAPQVKKPALRTFTFLLAKKGSGGGNYGLFFRVFGEQAPKVKKRLCALSLFLWQRKVPEGETMAFFSASSVSKPRK